MHNPLIRWLGLVMILLIAPGIAAQDLQDYLSRYLGDNGKKYLQPLGDAFGANLNSGLYHTAHIPRVGLHIGVEVIATGALISDAQRSFTATTEAGFEPQTSLEVPTVFGETAPVAVPGQGGTVYNFPGGYDLSVMPLAMPQITIGSLLGSEVTLRYAALELNEEVGDLNLLGIGFRHSLSQYIPLFPVDVAASVFYQTLTVGDLLDAKTRVIGLSASKTFNLFTLYGGLSHETSVMEASYEHGEGEEAETISFDMEGANSVRLTLGATLKLAIFRLHADYSLAAQNSACVGLYIGL